MTTHQFHISEQLAALGFEEQVLLLNALRKAIDHCLRQHGGLLAEFPGCTDRYWIEHGQQIYRLYRKLGGLETYPELN